MIYNNDLIYFTDEEFHNILRVAPNILKGRRGLSTKSYRIKKKIFIEVVLKVVSDYIKEVK